MRADSHIHLFECGFSGGDPEGSELAGYQELRAQHNIVKALVVGYEGEPTHRGNNAYLATLTKAHDWIAPLAYVDSARPPTAQELKDLWRDGIVGISLYLANHSDGTAWSAWPDSTMEELNSARAIISLNATPDATSALGKALERLRDTRILFSHLGLPGSHPHEPTIDQARKIIAPLLALSDQDNVGVKYSARYAISSPPHDPARPFVTLLLDKFGPSRLYWGSDYSPALSSVTFDQTLEIDHLTPDETSAVAGGNLLRILNQGVQNGH